MIHRVETAKTTLLRHRLQTPGPLCVSEITYIKTVIFGRKTGHCFAHVYLPMYIYSAVQNIAPFQI
uniref:Uncharacterized protein n=1 Tax=Cyprinodon variegatus TaxID=28743 RepID=A0A3Q2C8S0_CYPVA